jgi:hypothetical protein
MITEVEFEILKILVHHFARVPLDRQPEMLRAFVDVIRPSPELLRSLANEMPPTPPPAAPAPAPEEPRREFFEIWLGR